ncbi:DNA replication helicase Dna2, putative [Talaromyces stipitatus ATCC 10500]|uniref:DNA replication ATP-dependent helicase/nuclease n=1 Tax=Talaromyces stipitatus (strain ATCC 10500 / CBS 375.48 / QM 6759 / NRRL 1006) TaxID=441959 RepID=B8LWG5_TALSN|nr:DNA replication helicase Dna2, putative [Talaromyces stipitatus ATCC 10500]EED24276.1 DNA replication helicase Dna2, putative [Talaromyces stipitatus ATCC 10500]
MSTKQNPYISATSKSKLSNFQYVPNKNGATPKNRSPKKSTEATANADKENQRSWMNGVMEPPKSPGKSLPSTQPKETKPLSECPKTPANRIPLADLISNAEDVMVMPSGQEVTPDDYVSWQPAPRSSGTRRDTSSRGKKRRHSSSPTSSPLKDGTSKKPKGLFDMKNFEGLLKTPQTDVATDLWNKYIGKSNLEGTLEIPAKLTNLPSSPKTPASQKTGRDSSALRRSVSCNVDWPSSKTKRRRTEGVDGARTARDLFSRSRSNVLDSGSSTKLSFLLNKIQDTLASTKSNPKTNPPSSPPPLNDYVREDLSPSPSKKQQSKPSSSRHIPEVTMEGRNLGDQPQRIRKTHNLKSSSSDFGDDDLDDDLLALVDSSTQPVMDCVHGDDEVLNQVPQESLSIPQRKEMNEDPKVQQSRSQDNDDDDEFGDDIGFEEGMEELLTQYDKQMPRIQKQTLPQTTGGSSHVQPGTEVQPDAKTRNAGIADQNSFSDDEFEDKDLDLDNVLQELEYHSQKPKAQQAIKRYLIVQIVQSTYVTQKGYKQPEQVLSVTDEKTGTSKIIILRESWFDSPCTKNSYIHLIGDYDHRGHCIVDNAHNMIILHPDHLISATVVADAVTCQRRAVLQDRIKATSDINAPQVYGHILHEVFQEAMKVNQWDLQSMRTLVERILVQYVESLYAIHISIVEAVEHVMSKVPELQAWADVFLRPTPNADCMVEDRNGSKANLSINKLLEVEEHVWSPMYGLKGNVDATVQVAYNDGGDQKTLTIPLEMKTGKKDTSHSHRAQTSLYTLLLSDRYDIEVTFGLLYYLEMKKMFRIRGVRHELLQMIQERNRLAGFIREKMDLPPMIKRQHLCNQCYSKTACFVYHKLVDDGNGETSGLGQKFDEVVGHLDSRHADFFQKWDRLLTLEEKDMMKFRRELWTMLSTEREPLGRCFSGVVIEPGSAYEDPSGSKINRFRYTFVKSKAPPGFSFTESQITLGEPIVISDEKGHFALANGYVVRVSPKRISVAVDRRLHNARVRCKEFDVERNQSFKGIMEVGQNSSSGLVEDSEEEQMVYRLDKDEFSNGMATIRNNLVSLMENFSLSIQLRKLILEGKTPEFKMDSSSLDAIVSSSQANLNIDQKQAIDKVMSAKDYALILGMPGTGKTTTIAHIIRALVSQGKSVLLTSYTHTAVDNILLKIKNDNIRTLRLGAVAKVHPEVQQFVDLAAIPKKSIEELKESYERSEIVATTCLGINHPIFNERIFDYCIVDEASQITLPVCLGPIRMAKTFILVGDHYQLPPLVQSKAAQEGGLDVSLFKFLSDAQPSSVTNLEHQYRMCEEIMLLSNTLIYSGRLKCGNEEVASRSVKIPNFHDGIKNHHVTSVAEMTAGRCPGPTQARCWLKDLLDPSAKTRLVNTDTLSGRGPENLVGSRLTNTSEATLCVQIVQAFISSGISPREIGVITFYRSQLSLLRQSLRQYSTELEMHTTDKFQGRDKEIVILSCVRSNNDKQVGDLLRDWHRINVAFTRARTKLLVIGSKSTLRDGNELLQKYVSLMESRQWVYDLPKNALQDHVFDASEGDSAIFSPTQQRQHHNIQTSPSIKKSISSNVRLTPDKHLKRKYNGPGSPLSPSAQHKIFKRESKMRTPEKRGNRATIAEKFVHKRPILHDLLNEFIG